MTSDSPQLSSALAPPLEQEFQLGNWWVNPRLNQLCLTTAAVEVRSLEPRIMHLLCFLAANPREVLSREQLTRELWPAVVVNENSLTRAISELRKQLGNGDRAGADYLQTISKRGYRLTAAVQLLFLQRLHGRQRLIRGTIRETIRGIN